jgi:hypothetical protein
LGGARIFKGEVKEFFVRTYLQVLLIQASMIAPKK